MRLLLALALCLPLSLSAGGSPLKAGDNAVAWKASKRFLFKQLSPAGINTAASAEIVPVAKDSYTVKVFIPIDKFDSGNADRDKDVLPLLAFDIQPVMIFESTPLTAKDLSTLRKSGGTLEGLLSKGHKNYPVKFMVNADGQTLAGATVVKLSELDVKAPSAMAGLLMKVSDEMQLFFQYDVKNIKGQEKIK